jgi:hypothetical protein
MRKVLMIGTHVALPPYAVGVKVWVDELAAYTLGKITPTPELAYVDARDVISDAQGALLMAMLSANNEQLWADRIGPIFKSHAGNFVGPVEDDVATTATHKIEPRWL